MHFTNQFRACEGKTLPLFFNKQLNYVCHRALEMQDLTDPQHAVNSGTDATSKLDKNILGNSITTNGTGGKTVRRTEKRTQKYMSEGTTY